MSNDPKDTKVDLSKLVAKLAPKELESSDDKSITMTAIISLLLNKGYDPIIPLCLCDCRYGIQIVFANKENKKISMPEGFESTIRYQYGENVVYIASYFNYGRSTTFGTRYQLTQKKLQVIFDWVKELE